MKERGKGTDVLVRSPASTRAGAGAGDQQLHGGRNGPDPSPPVPSLCVLSLGENLEREKGTSAISVTLTRNCSTCDSGGGECGGSELHCRGFV